VPAPSRDGGTLERDVVVHSGAVVLLPILDDGRIVLIRNHRFAIDETLWELPAGTLEPPEPAIDCAARELREETGYAADSLEPLGRFYSAPGFCTELLHAFVATGLTAVGQDLEPTEHIAVHPVSREELDRLLGEGAIVDAKTLATLFLWQRSGD
jgi:ADP-ribose pyrophosphatase